MPRMVLCGRRIHASSDDCIFLPMLSLFFRLLWISAVITLSVLERINFINFSDSGGGCGDLILSYLLLSLVISCIGVVIDCLLIVKSAAGTLVNDTPRKQVPLLLSVRLFWVLPELAVAIYGVIVTSFGTATCIDKWNNDALKVALVVFAALNFAFSAILLMGLGCLWAVGVVGPPPISNFLSKYPTFFASRSALPAAFAGELLSYSPRKGSMKSRTERRYSWVDEESPLLKETTAPGDGTSVIGDQVRLSMNPKKRRQQLQFLRAEEVGDRYKPSPYGLLEKGSSTNYVQTQLSGTKTTAQSAESENDMYPSSESGLVGQLRAKPTPAKALEPTAPVRKIVPTLPFALQASEAISLVYSSSRWSTHCRRISNTFGDPNVWILNLWYCFTCRRRRNIEEENTFNLIGGVFAATFQLLEELDFTLSDGIAAVVLTFLRQKLEKQAYEESLVYHNPQVGWAVPPDSEVNASHTSASDDAKAMERNVQEAGAHSSQASDYDVHKLLSQGEEDGAQLIHNTRIERGAQQTWYALLDAESQSIAKRMIKPHTYRVNLNMYPPLHPLRSGMDPMPPSMYPILADICHYSTFTLGSYGVLVYMYQTIPYFICGLPILAVYHWSLDKFRWIKEWLFHSLKNGEEDISPEREEDAPDQGSENELAAVEPRRRGLGCRRFRRTAVSRRNRSTSQQLWEAETGEGSSPEGGNVMANNRSQRFLEVQPSVHTGQAADITSSGQVTMSLPDEESNAITAYTAVSGSRAEVPILLHADQPSGTSVPSGLRHESQGTIQYMGAHQPQTARPSAASSAFSATSDPLLLHTIVPSTPISVHSLLASASDSSYPNPLNNLESARLIESYGRFNQNATTAPDISLSVLQTRMHPFLKLMDPQVTGTTLIRCLAGLCLVPTPRDVQGSLAYSIALVYEPTMPPPIAPSTKKDVREVLGVSGQAKDSNGVHSALPSIQESSPMHLGANIESKKSVSRSPKRRLTFSRMAYSSQQLVSSVNSNRVVGILTQEGIVVFQELSEQEHERLLRLCTNFHPTAPLPLPDARDDIRLQMNSENAQIPSRPGNDAQMTTNARSRTFAQGNGAENDFHSPGVEILRLLLSLPPLPKPSYLARSPYSSRHYALYRWVFSMQKHWQRGRLFLATDSIFTALIPKDASAKLDTILFGEDNDAEKALEEAKQEGDLGGTAMAENLSHRNIITGTDATGETKLQALPHAPPTVHASKSGRSATIGREADQVGTAQVPTTPAINKTELLAGDGPTVRQRSVLSRIRHAIVACVRWFLRALGRFIFFILQPIVMFVAAMQYCLWGGLLDFDRMALFRYLKGGQRRDKKAVVAWFRSVLSEYRQQTTGHTDDNGNGVGAEAEQRELRFDRGNCLQDGSVASRESGNTSELAVSNHIPLGRSQRTATGHPTSTTLGPPSPSKLPGYNNTQPLLQQEQGRMTAQPAPPPATPNATSSSASNRPPVTEQPKPFPTLPLQTGPLFSSPDLLHVSSVNAFFQVPYFLSIDRIRRTLVLTVRGTLSIKDIITDAVAFPYCLDDDPERDVMRRSLRRTWEKEQARLTREGNNNMENETEEGGGMKDVDERAELSPLFDPFLDPKNWFVHAGMWQAARTLRDEMLRIGVLHLLEIEDSAEDLWSKEWERYRKHHSTESVFPSIVERPILRPAAAARPPTGLGGPAESPTPAPAPATRVTESIRTTTITPPSEYISPSAAAAANIPLLPPIFQPPKASLWARVREYFLTRPPESTARREGESAPSATAVTIEAEEETVSAGGRRSDASSRYLESLPPSLFEALSSTTQTHDAFSALATRVALMQPSRHYRRGSLGSESHRRIIHPHEQAEGFYPALSVRTGRPPERDGAAAASPTASEALATFPTSSRSTVHTPRADLQETVTFRRGEGEIEDMAFKVQEETREKTDAAGTTHTLRRQRLDIAAGDKELGQLPLLGASPGREPSIPLGAAAKGAESREEIFYGAKAGETGAAAEKEGPHGRAPQEIRERVRQAFGGKRPPPLRLVVCGHSLGAGVAALVSVLLKPYYPSLRCYTYAPPAALVSPHLATALFPFVTTLIVGGDIISRMSVTSLQLLSREMLHVTLNTKVGKGQVFLRTFLHWLGNRLTPWALKGALGMGEGKIWYSQWLQWLLTPGAEQQGKKTGQISGSRWRKVRSKRKKVTEQPNLAQRLDSPYPQVPPTLQHTGLPKDAEASTAGEQAQPAQLTRGSLALGGIPSLEPDHPSQSALQYTHGVARTTDYPAQFDITIQCQQSTLSPTEFTTVRIDDGTSRAYAIRMPQTSDYITAVPYTPPYVQSAPKNSNLLPIPAELEIPNKDLVPEFRQYLPLRSDLFPGAVPKFNRRYMPLDPDKLFEKDYYQAAESEYLQNIRLVLKKEKFHRWMRLKETKERLRREKAERKREHELAQLRRRILRQNRGQAIQNGSPRETETDRNLQAAQDSLINAEKYVQWHKRPTLDHPTSSDLDSVASSFAPGRGRIVSNGMQTDPFSTPEQTVPIIRDQDQERSHGGIHKYTGTSTSSDAPPTNKRAHTSSTAPSHVSALDYERQSTASSVILHGIGTRKERTPARSVERERTVEDAKSAADDFVKRPAPTIFAAPSNVAPGMSAPIEAKGTQATGQVTAEPEDKEERESIEKKARELATLLAPATSLVLSRLSLLRQPMRVPGRIVYLEEQGKMPVDSMSYCMAHWFGNLFVAFSTMNWSLCLSWRLRKRWIRRWSDLLNGKWSAYEKSIQDGYPSPDSRLYRAMQEEVRENTENSIQTEMSGAGTAVGLEVFPSGRTGQEAVAQRSSLKRFDLCRPLRNWRWKRQRKRNQRRLVRLVTEKEIMRKIWMQASTSNPQLFSMQTAPTSELPQIDRPVTDAFSAQNQVPPQLRYTKDMENCLLSLTMEWHRQDLRATWKYWGRVVGDALAAVFCCCTRRVERQYVPRVSRGVEVDYQRLLMEAIKEPEIGITSPGISPIQPSEGLEVEEEQVPSPVPFETTAVSPRIQGLPSALVSTPSPRRRFREPHEVSFRGKTSPILRSASSPVRSKPRPAPGPLESELPLRPGLPSLSKPEEDEQLEVGSRSPSRLSFTSTRSGAEKQQILRRETRNIAALVHAVGGSSWLAKRVRQKRWDRRRQTSLPELVFSTEKDRERRGKRGEEWEGMMEGMARLTPEREDGEPSSRIENEIEMATGPTDRRHSRIHSAPGMSGGTPLVSAQASGSAHASQLVTSGASVKDLLPTIQERRGREAVKGSGDADIRDAAVANGELALDTEKVEERADRESQVSFGTLGAPSYVSDASWESYESSEISSIRSFSWDTDSENEDFVEEHYYQKNVLNPPENPFRRIIMGTGAVLKHFPDVMEYAITTDTIDRLGLETYGGALIEAQRIHYFES